jgi:polysaccharide pyruvyl transferase WcaK-like protein
LDRIIALIGRLIADNHIVVCFTDGADEDELFLARCRDRLREMDMIGDQAVIWPRCTNPAELARLVGSFDVVIAHRLHACILAYSYRVPSIGLKWDSKLQAFFDVVGQFDGVLDFERTSNDAFASRVAAALATPFPVERHRAVLKSARAGVHEMANGLKKILANEAGGPEERAVA